MGRLGAARSEDGENESRIGLAASDYPLRCTKPPLKLWRSWSLPSSLFISRCAVGNLTFRPPAAFVPRNRNGSDLWRGPSRHFRLPRLPVNDFTA